MAVDPPKLFRIGKRPAASAEKARPAIIESHVQGADPPFCSASSTTTKKEGGKGGEGLGKKTRSAFFTPILASAFFTRSLRVFFTRSLRVFLLGTKPWT